VTLLLLVLARTAGMVAAAPVFGDKTFPISVKAAVSIALAMAFVPLVSAPDSMPLLVPGLAAEFAIGLTIGFAASLLFAGIKAGGSLLDQQMGLSLAGVLDPSSGEEETPVARLQLMLALVIYVLVDGHHQLVGATLDSFRAMPVGGAFDASAAQHLLDLAGGMFAIALKVAGPALAALLIAGIAMSFAARAVPQIDSFALSVPLRAIIGFVVLAISAGMIARSVAR